MGYDQVNKRHLEENMALSYRQGDESFIEKARKAEPIGTIKQMGGREVIKTANGWRAHTKGSASKTKEHLEKNPSANHKDEHLEKFSKETPEAELKRVIKESTDPRLREHANKELARRKEEESGKPKEERKDVHENFTAQDHFKAFEEHSKKYADALKVTEPLKKKYLDGKLTPEEEKQWYAANKQYGESGTKAKEHYKQYEKLSKKEKKEADSKEAHEKRGFDEKKGDEDVTGKGEEIPKETKVSFKTDLSDNSKKFIETEAKAQGVTINNLDVDYDRKIGGKKRLNATFKDAEGNEQIYQVQFGLGGEGNWSGKHVKVWHAEGNNMVQVHKLEAFDRENMRTYETHYSVHDNGKDHDDKENHSRVNKQIGDVHKKYLVPKFQDSDPYAEGMHWIIAAEKERKK